MIKRILSEVLTVQDAENRSSRQINFSCRFQLGKYVEHAIAGEYIRNASQVYGQGVDKLTRAILLLIAYEKYVNEQLDGEEPVIDEALAGFVEWIDKANKPSKASARK